MVIKKFQQTKIHLWPKKQELWADIHIDYVHVKGIGIFLILVNSFPGWPEVVRVQNRMGARVKEKHILKGEFDCKKGTLLAPTLICVLRSTSSLPIPFLSPSGGSDGCEGYCWNS